MMRQSSWIYSNPENQREPEQSSLIPFINYNTPAPKRCLDMLLAKYNNLSFQTEVIMSRPSQPPVPVLGRPLWVATILLITDGGLVPKGNPDGMASVNAGIYHEYNIKGCERLESGQYEVSHQGYDNALVNEDPNRLLPVDVLRELSCQGVIGRLYDGFITTTGVMVSAERSQRLGHAIAVHVKRLPVDAVIITSACGTSTRCGANIGLELEKIGIPVVQITNLTKIAFDTGMRRVIRGNSVSAPLGWPSMNKQNELECRKKLVLSALGELQAIK